MHHLRLVLILLDGNPSKGNCYRKRYICFFHEQGYFWISTPIIYSVHGCRMRSVKMFAVSTLDYDEYSHDDQVTLIIKKTFLAKETFLTGIGQLKR